VNGIRGLRRVAPGVDCLSLLGAVNVVFLSSGDGRWWLVDTGLGWHFSVVKRASEQLFGPGSRPEAILLTSARPDHAGGASALATYWDVPVRLDPAAWPLADGTLEWPKDDTGAGDLAGWVARVWKPGPVDLGGLLAPLEDLPDGWTALPLAGPSPGHTGFWRESDRVLIAGDALATVNIETVPGLLRPPTPALPPAPWILDWESLRKTWRTIAALAPSALVCGHGRPMVGERVAGLLEHFAEYKVMVRHGRHINEPVRLREDGTFNVVPDRPDPALAVARAAGMVLAAGMVIWWMDRRRRRA
jgi:glyoxylase-like metal-dependent hydrolase (beta-lactamase superfamily II)